MTIQEVVDRILAYHPCLPDYQGCDSFKCGDPGAECTGIVTALTATVSVVRKAAGLGANLIIVHEPTNYTSADYPGWREDFPNEVFGEKERLLTEHGIAVWRDHDHLHAHRPDGIFTGVLRAFGWEEYHKTDFSMGPFASFLVELPEKTTLKALLKTLRETIGMNGIRYIGPEDMPIGKLALAAHLYPMGGADRRNRAGFPKEYSVELIRYFEEEGVDAILPGETIDWTLLSYVRDAVQLGQKKAIIQLGHFNWEELGMRYAAQWLPPLLDGKTAVTYVPSEDMYSYYL